NYPYLQNQPIVTQGALVDGVFEPNARHSGTRLPERPAPRFGDMLSHAAPALRSARQGASGVSTLLGLTDAVGSNAWLVSGAHTASGAPILANDPHLAPTMPGAWYELGLHCNVVD